MMSNAFVSGVTIVKNAVKFDYPIVECINSILPLVDEYIISIGDGNDETEALIKAIASPKIKIVHSVWDTSFNTGGTVLAVETDKALLHVNKKADWVFYLQADEVVHENDYPAIQQALLKYKSDENVDGLLFKYKHFYGTFDYIGDSRRWYNHEIRIIKNNPQIKSYRDAQGFKKNNQKLFVKLIDAYIYHYGWVRTPKAQQAKLANFYSYWNGGNQTQFEEELFDYMKNVDSVAIYTGTHPKVMKHRIDNWQYPIEWNVKKKNLNFKDRILYYFEKITGYRPFAYKNYKIR
jgi:hypothetical protein